MINWRIGAAVVFAAGAAIGFEARAQVDDAAATVLKESAAAIEKLQGVSYKSKLYGVGPLKDYIDGEGEVKQLRVAGATVKKSPVWIKGGVKELKPMKTPVLVFNDGDIVSWIDDEQNTHFKRPAGDKREADAQRVYGLASQLLLGEFTEPTPFAVQLKAQKIEMQPNEQINGVDCRVVVLTWEGGLRSQVWWIGAQDHLPRKHELAHGEGRAMAKGWELSDVKAMESPNAADLALKTPAGYKEDFKTAIAPPPPKPQDQPFQQPQQIQPPPVVGLAPGTAAPEFDLKSGTGTSVKLSSAKGNVVVLTFGGSRFPKTDAINTMVSGVVAANKDKVQAYTLACREDSDQAAIEHATKANPAIPVLLGADNIRNEYKVAGFPFTYVLTSDGRVSYAFQGAVSKEQLEKAVAAALKGEVAELPKAPTPAPVPAPVAKPGPAVAPTPTGVKPDVNPAKK